MKKLTFLLALMMITTFAMAQRGQNGYHGQRGQNGFHGQQGQRHTQVYRGQNYGSQYRGEVRYNRGQRGVNQGWNQRQVRVHNNGWNNGWNQTWTNGQRRTRWEYSNCGKSRSVNLNMVSESTLILQTP